MDLNAVTERTAWHVPHVTLEVELPPHGVASVTLALSTGARSR